jgi:hypothetical protein
MEEEEARLGGEAGGGSGEEGGVAVEGGRHGCFVFLLYCLLWLWASFSRQN